jgi:hypothetical protein
MVLRCIHEKQLSCQAGFYDGQVPEKAIIKGGYALSSKR